MSELKAVHAFDVYEAYTKTGDDDAAQVYLKSEADNVIAELKDKIQQKDFFFDGCGFSKMGFKNTIDVANYVDELKARIHELESMPHTDNSAVIERLSNENERLKAIRKVHVEAIESMGAGLLQDDNEIRRQKYKRCLAMAEWCDAEADVADADGDYEDMRWYQKWHNRWLAIAEKFKTNSTAQ